MRKGKGHAARMQARVLKETAPEIEAKISYDSACFICGHKPIIVETDMCAVCTTGESDLIGEAL